MTRDHDAGAPPQQLLHLVFGGELKDIQGHEFADLNALDIVGIFPSYAEAAKAWRAAAQRTVDSAQTRYFVVHMHRLLEPDPVVSTRSKPAAAKSRPGGINVKPAKPKTAPRSTRGKGGGQA